MFAIGVNTVTVTATDAYGNASTKSFTVTVRDTAAPVITSWSPNLTAEATSPAGAVVTYADRDGDGCGRPDHVQLLEGFGRDVRAGHDDGDGDGDRRVREPLLEDLHGDGA